MEGAIWQLWKFGSRSEVYWAKVVLGLSRNLTTYLGRTLDIGLKYFTKRHRIRFVLDQNINNFGNKQKTLFFKGIFFCFHEDFLALNTKSPIWGFIINFKRCDKQKNDYIYAVLCCYNFPNLLGENTFLKCKLLK